MHVVVIADNDKIVAVALSCDHHYVDEHDFVHNFVAVVYVVEKFLVVANSETWVVVYAAIERKPGVVVEKNC